MGTTRLTYRGPPALAGALAQELEKQGLTVTWKPPFETKSWGVENVLVPMLVAGGYDLIKLAVREFHRRFPGADIDVGDEDDD